MSLICPGATPAVIAYILVLGLKTIILVPTAIQNIPPTKFAGLSRCIAPAKPTGTNPESTPPNIVAKSNSFIAES